MKILFVTPYLPGPPVFGGQRRMHGLLTALSADHEVSILSLVDGSADQRAGIADARQYCRNVVTVSDTRHRVSGRTKRLLQLRALFSPKSWERFLYERPAFQRALDSHLAQYEYDVLNCEFVFMAGYRFAQANRGRRPRLALDEHNIEYDILRRTAGATSFDRKVFNAVNWRKLQREEIGAWRRFDGVSLTSARDEQFVTRHAPRVRTAVVPNGVDIDAFRARDGASVEPMTILFFGAINYYPNTDAVLFFVREVLPHILARHPRARLRVVGPGAPGSILALGSQQVQIVGFVDDLRAEIERAGVVVAPLRIGGGTRLKILEAMSMGRPVVSTSIGAEGLDTTHESDILLADSAESLAGQVGRVLADPELARRLGARARETVEQKYSWRAAAAKLTAFYETLVDQ